MVVHFTVTGENFVFQQINPTGVVWKLFIIDVSALKSLFRDTYDALQNHIEHSILNNIVYQNLLYPIVTNMVSPEMTSFLAGKHF